MTKIAIVILNWNGISLLRGFIPSVLKYSEGENVTIWVADNGSEDDSVNFLSTEFPQVNLMEFEQNLGFTGGYNKAFSVIEAEYYILLNSDVEVTAEWLEPMLRLMEDDSGVAVCVPKIKDLNRREFFEYAGASGGFIDFLGYPFCRGRLFESIERDTGQYDDEKEIFWATGACMMIRAADWHAEGGFDERFFAHMEEIDLCWRLKNKGRKIMVCPSSVVFHLGGGTLPRYHPKKTYYNFRNSLLMLLRNLPRRKLYLLLIRWLFDWMSVIKFLAAFSFRNALAVIRAHLGFLRLSGVYLSQRKKADKNNILPDHREIYRKSIVIDFFLRKRKKFTSLEF